MSDPRMNGFNYGAGWGSDPKPPVYQTALNIARSLRKHSSELSQQAWELDMAIRDVRLATLGVEKAAAVGKLESLLRDQYGV